MHVKENRDSNVDNTSGRNAACPTLRCVCLWLRHCTVTSDNRNCKFQGRQSPGDFETVER